MAIGHRLLGAVRALLHRRQTEDEMDAELRAFVEASAERRMRAGVPEQEARRAARFEMGSLESVKDGIRDAGWETAVEAFWADVRYSARVLAKAPVFTGVVVLTLALGIGANTAIFSLIDSLLLKTLPVEKPEELVQINDFVLTNSLWEQIRNRQELFSGVFAWGSVPFNLSTGGMVRNADGLWVSGDIFRTLGLRPAAGRLFTVDDDRRGCGARAVLSYILRRVMGDVARVLACGIAAGIAIAFATTRLLNALLFGLTARDPFTLAPGALIAAVSLAAGLFAARRAVTIDPMTALRQE